MSSMRKMYKSNNMQGKLSPSAKDELDLMQGTVFVGGESLGTDPDKKKKKKGKNMKKSVTPNELKLGYLELFAKSGSPPRPTDMELFEIIEDYGDFKFGKKRSLQKSEWVFFSYNEQGGRWNGKNLVRLVKSMLTKGGRLTPTQEADYARRDIPRDFKGPEGRRSALSPSAPLFQFDTTPAASRTRHAKPGEEPPKRIGADSVRLHPTQDTPEEVERDKMTPAQRAELRAANIAESTKDASDAADYEAGAAKRAAAMRADRRGSAKLRAAETMGLRVRGPFQSGIDAKEQTKYGWQKPPGSTDAKGELFPDTTEMGTSARSQRVREALYSGKVQRNAEKLTSARRADPEKYGESSSDKELTEELADIGTPPSKREPEIGHGGGVPEATYWEGRTKERFTPKKVTDGKTKLGEIQGKDKRATERQGWAAQFSAETKKMAENTAEMARMREMAEAEREKKKAEEVKANDVAAAAGKPNPKAPFVGPLRPLSDYAAKKSFASMENTPFPFKMYPQPMQSSFSKSQSTYRSDDYLVELLAKEIGIPRYEVERRVARVDQPLRKSGT